MPEALPTWYRYWGKARPEVPGGDGYHLLPYHNLDVAACGQVLVRLPRFSLSKLAGELGWEVDVAKGVFSYFLALHDVGKFAPGFQGFAPGLSPELVAVSRMATPHRLRHDALGWLLWRKVIAASDASHTLPDVCNGFWQTWARIAMGHHGVPPDETGGHGVYVPQVTDYFRAEDQDAVRSFDQAMQSLFLPTVTPIPTKPQRTVIREFSWMLAGIAVLADWLGSAQRDFAYRSSVMPVDEYWNKVALPAAEVAVARAGLMSAPARLGFQLAELLPDDASPSPLQRYADEVPLETGPQLFILEDVAGSGKTEAALLLTQRLMVAGRAQGFYFALPTMATATQMYDRVGRVYRRMFDPDGHPSLVLAHSARDLVDGFRESVIVSEDGGGATPSRNDPGLDAGAECAAWLADSRKKALLADVGVGTIDQALLAVLPVRHQSLRMVGLSGKVLIVDEVHAYDTYMLQLLKLLLEHHARNGGSAILLSATISLNVKGELLNAFARGRGAEHSPDAAADRRYPLATHAGTAIRLHSCPTREPLRRSVCVVMLHDEEEVVRLLAKEAAKGKCVGWIRNTVEDARRGYRELASRLPAGTVTLFHSRFALGDRLAIEQGVVNRFGRASTGAGRQGLVLVGTQVLEQSLDYDLDRMVSDWAPIDLIIQRAGRLMRHARTADGSLAKDGREGRGEPVLYVLVPALVDPPESEWYSALFPKAQYVYEDTGRLWLGADAQRHAGRIDTPGEIGASASVRALVEAVYGDEAAEIPEALQAATIRVEGAAAAEQGMGVFNSLRLDRGYTAASSVRWSEDDRVPTRLGEESRTIYLAVATQGGLVPLKGDLQRPWENSAVRVDARRFCGLGAEWAARFGGPIGKLRSSIPLLREPAFILPLVSSADGVLRGTVSQSKGPEFEVSYEATAGLDWRPAG